MTKDFIQNLLYDFQCLPISNLKLKKFDVYLSSNSPVQEYLNTKKKICTHVPKGTSGVYIIAKNEKILLLIFKLKEYQDSISIYYWSLLPHFIDKRKTIEELLTIALKPECNKWHLQK